MQSFYPSLNRALIGCIILISSTLLLAGCFERADWSPNSRYAAKAQKRHLYIYDVKKKTAYPIFTEPRKDYRLGHVRFLDNDTVLLLRYQEPQVEVRLGDEVVGEKKPLKPMNLTIIDRHTGKHRDLVTMEALTELSQLWAGFAIAPDGKSVVFVESPGKDEVRLKEIGINSGEVRDLGVSAMKPAFSPDGKFLAALDVLDKKRGMFYLLSPDGTVVAKREIKSASPFCETVWAPSGTHLYFCSGEKTVSRLSVPDLSHKVIYQTDEENEQVVSLHPSKNELEFYVTLIRHIAESRGINFAATVSGKIKMFAQTFGIGTVLIKHDRKAMIMSRLRGIDAHKMTSIVAGFFSRVLAGTETDS